MKMLTIHNHRTSTPDCCWCIEGEIAYPGLVCGCRDRASTTVIVRDVELDFDDIVSAYVGYLEAAGWAEIIGDRHSVEARACETVADGAAIAADYSTGTVLRRVFDRDSQQWRYSEL